MLAGLGTPILGGNDKIYGGDDITGTQTIAGGTYDDLIYSGTNVSDDITIFGDNDTATPLTEDAAGLNINDGNDIIDVGNDNMNVKVYGQGGNDKIIGGFGVMQIDRLYGGSGDDKIWLVNPEQREFDTLGKDYGYGGLGNDYIYGTDAGDEIFGDAYNNPNDESVVADDLEGGDDVLRGYGGDD